MNKLNVSESMQQQLLELAQEKNLSVDDLLASFISSSNGNQANQNDQNDQYIGTLLDATKTLSNTFDIDDLLFGLLEYLAIVVPYDSASVMMLEDNEVLVVQYRIGAQSANHDWKENTLSSIKWDLADTANLVEIYQSLQPLVIPDVSKYANWREHPLTDWIQSHIGLPIISNDFVVGFVNLDKAEANYYKQSHAELALPFAHLAGIAMQNARLYTAVSQNADELAALYHATSVLFQADDLQDFSAQVTEVVVRAFDYADCGLMVLNPEKTEMIRVARSGIDAMRPQHKILLDAPGLVPKAVQQGQLVYAPNVFDDKDYVTGDNRTKSELVIPLKTGAGIIGVLDFQSPQEDAFSERDQRIVLAFAERVAPALENVILYERLKTYTSELEWNVQLRTMELLQTKEQLETIINSSADAILVIDEKTHIRQANPALLSLLQYPVEDFADKSLIQFLTSESVNPFLDMLKKVIHGKANQTIEVVLRNYNHAEIAVDISLAPVIGGMDVEIVCNIRDITARKATERALRDALQKSEELGHLKSRFVTMASHEFRTPLTIILSSSDIVKQYHNRLDENKLRHHMVKIQKQVSHLNHLIDDILVIGKVESDGFTAKYETENLSELCYGWISELQETDNYQHIIDFTVSEGCKEIMVDKDLFSHIFNNLLSNAHKYSEPHSMIYISVQCDEGISITVRDEGIGIPREELNNVFDRFHRGTNVGSVAGTGMGLAIVKQAIDALGGTASIKSDQGKGTEFKVTLPFYQQKSLE